MHRKGTKRAHFVLQFVALEVLIRKVPNLAQINAISTKPRILLELTLENKVVSSSKQQQPYRA